MLKQGWYYPVFKGVDPVGRILMFKVNDYLEIKDVHIPHAYLDEFAIVFENLLDNYKDTLVDVSVLHAFNGEPIHDCDENIQKIVADLGFRSMGDNQRYIRGGVVDPWPFSCHSFTVPPPSSSPRYAFRKRNFAIDTSPRFVMTSH